MPNRPLRIPLLWALLAIGCGAPASNPGPGPDLDAGVPVSPVDAGHEPVPPVDAGAPEVTWYRDVLPVAQARCQSCHQEGGIAPFALATYEQAKPHHAKMAENVAAGLMPPWPPAASCQSFLDSRRLGPDEVRVFQRWSALGAPAGNPADAPMGLPPAVPGLERVDVDLDIGTDYVPASGVEDDYHCFLLDPALATTRDVIGLDLEPGVRKMIHHVLVFTAPMADARAADQAQPGAGWTCYGSSGIQKAELVGGWVPGMPPTHAPAGTGVPIPAGNALVAQIHYNLAQGVLPDRTRVKLMLSPERVAHPARLLPLTQTGFSIPPHSQGYSANNQVSLPFSAVIWGVLPHMHQLGKHLRVEKGGACLMDIPRWDFHWQQLYFYEQPVMVSAGESVKLTCTWDNPGSTAIGWGEGTSDEMCLNYFYVTF